MRRHFKIILSIASLTLLAAVSQFTIGNSPVLAQQPTGSVPTVTGTVSGPLVTVYADLVQVDVYAGPSTYLYPAVGVLLSGQSAPALGRARDEDWIQILYPGIPGASAWIYAPYVRISPGAKLSQVEAPPTPTPFSTPTIDPTLAAAFIVAETPTRLPTFTPPAAQVLPAFDDQEISGSSRVPLGLVIFSLGFIGALGVALSFLRGR
jgi:uncharacterized protein YraI